MKWIILTVFVVAASAVTVYRGEDNVAMESHNERGRTREYDSEGRRNPPRRHRESDKEEKRYRGKQRDTSEEESQHVALVPESYHDSPTAYFANIQEDGSQKLGFSSYIHHHGDKESIGDGSNMEIQKLVPKSSMHIEMYHDQTETPHNFQLPSKVSQKEASHSKLKVKPPKFYHEAANNYKKAPKPAVIVKDFYDTTPSFYSSVSSETVRPKPQYAKRKPFTERLEPIRALDMPNNHKAESFSESFSGIGSFDSSSSPIITKSTHWDPMSDNVEIAVSSESHSKRTRRPKDIPSHLFSSHGYNFQSEQKVDDQRYKSERFDHDKALKASTMFDIDNVVGFGATVKDLESIPRPVTLKPEGFKFSFGSTGSTSQGPIQFSNTDPSQPATRKPIYNNYNFPPITEEEFDKQFGHFNGKDIKPLLSQKYRPELKQELKTEFKPNFRPDFKQGLKQEFKPEFKPSFRPEFKPKRVPFDGRTELKKPHSVYIAPPVLKSQALSQSQQHTAHSFSSFSSHGDFSNSKNTKENGNVSLLPAFKIGQESVKKEITVAPERPGRVLSDHDDGSSPQQFSVSASYQIDRNNRSG